MLHGKPTAIVPTIGCNCSVKALFCCTILISANVIKNDSDFISILCGTIDFYICIQFDAYAAA